jgi:ribosomal-protein-alanine N-acetyltransferase
MDIALSAPSAADANEFLEAVRASRGLHHPWTDPPDTPERFAAYLERVAGDEFAGRLIRHAGCGQLVGYVNINNIVRGPLLSACLGYSAFASHAGRGLMATGVRAVIDTAFNELGLNRLEANIQPNNDRSIHLVRRLGFELEGFSRRYLWVDGAWRDHQRWALLAEYWTDRVVIPDPS